MDLSIIFFATIMFLEQNCYHIPYIILHRLYRIALLQITLKLKSFHKNVCEGFGMHPLYVYICMSYYKKVLQFNLLRVE